MYNWRGGRGGNKIKADDWNYNFGNTKSAIEAAEATFDAFYANIGYMFNDIIVSGGAVTPHVSGVTVDITACIAYVNGEFYVLDAQSLNLTVPGAGAYTVAVVVDNTGTIVQVLGDTGNPHTPPTTTSDQLRLANVYLQAADTIVHADDIDLRLVYTVYDMRNVIDYVNALKVIKAYGLYIYFSAGSVKIGNTFYAITAGTLLLTDTNTNYVFVNNAGAVAANTTGYPTDSIPMATVVCAAGVTGAITDNRVVRINKYLQGDGIVISGSGIAVDLATNPGLQMTSNKLDLKLLAGGGLTKDATGLFLTLGAANLKHFMNADGTALEFAAGIKIGVFTREMDAATADVGYTGVGFKPSNIIFVAVVPSGFMNSIGADNLTIYAVKYGLSTTTDGYTGSYSIFLREGTGLSQGGKIKTFDADGFTFAWARAGLTAAGTISIFYIAFR